MLVTMVMRDNVHDVDIIRSGLVNRNLVGCYTLTGWLRNAMANEPEHG